MRILRKKGIEYLSNLQRMGYLTFISGKGGTAEKTVYRFEYWKLKYLHKIKIKTKIRLGKYYTSFKYH